MSRPRVALVVPARNEAALLPGVLAEVPDFVWRIILVDDGSTDETWEVIRRWRDPRAVRIRNLRALGVGGAILAGYRRALRLGAEVAAVAAGDGQMALGELDRVVEPVRTGRADYVQGSRFDAGRPRGTMPLTRQWGNRLLSRATTWAAGGPVGDSQCGYTAASGRFLARLDPTRLPPGYGFPAYLRIEAHRMQARVVEVPVAARYGDEVSGIQPLVDPPRILARILWRGVRRRLEAWRERDAVPARALHAPGSGEAG